MSKAKRNGGYVLVDFTGVNIESETPVVIQGIFEKCKDALESNKPIYVMNLVSEYDDVSVAVSPMAGYAMHPIQEGVIDNTSIYITTASYIFYIEKTGDRVTVSYNS